MLSTESVASECSSFSDPRAAKKDVDAEAIDAIRCTSTVSMYHDSFSCRIALVCKAFRAGAGWCFIVPFDPASPDSGSLGSTSDFSETTSKILGFSSSKFSSKYTLGMVDSGVVALGSRRGLPPDLRRTTGEGGGESVLNESVGDAGPESEVPRRANGGRCEPSCFVWNS